MTSTSDHIPVRTCVGCGGNAPRKGMIRLQSGRDGALCVVAGNAVAGRTAYLHAREDCVRALLRSKRLSRSLRKQIEPQAREEFMELVLEALARERVVTHGHTNG